MNLSVEAHTQMLRAYTGREAEPEPEWDERTAVFHPTNMMAYAMKHFLVDHNGDRVVGAGDGATSSPLPSQDELQTLVAGPLTRYVVISTPPLQPEQPPHSTPHYTTTATPTQHPHTIAATTPLNTPLQSLPHPHSTPQYNQCNNPPQQPP